MKTEKQLLKNSPDAVDIINRSIELFRSNDIIVMGHTNIPDDLLRAWMTGDPQQLLSDIADHKADPDSTLPFAVYSVAYGYHDQIYAAILKDESYRTPTETVIRNFFKFQEALYYLAELENRNIFTMPFAILNFRDYPKWLPLLKEIATGCKIHYDKEPV